MVTGQYRESSNHNIVLSQFLFGHGTIDLDIHQILLVSGNSSSPNRNVMRPGQPGQNLYEQPYLIVLLAPPLFDLKTNHHHH